MTPTEFEALLEQATELLTADVRADTSHHGAAAFEQLVLDVLAALAEDQHLAVKPARNSQGFPDISADPYGVEVKSVQADSWLTIGNSIFEGSRAATTNVIYVVFGKMGGVPEVRWARYGEVVSHVRTTHMPRFVLDLTSADLLFPKMQITYDGFCALDDEAKMSRVRSYARSRLKDGEHLWWLEDSARQPHALPLQVRLYRNLPDAEKLDLRAKAIVLSPQVLRGGRVRNKYDQVAMYLLTVHGVLCLNVRDLFTAGSVAGVSRPDDERGGLYADRSLQGLEKHLVRAFEELDDALFVEYWGYEVARSDRIREWLRLADRAAAPTWRPSERLPLLSRLAAQASD